jgi:hypothetical protein
MNKHVKVEKSSSVAALPVKVGVIHAACRIMAFASDPRENTIELHPANNGQSQKYH